MLNAAATMVWKNPYISPSQASYIYIDMGHATAGVAKWQGSPLLLQFGIDYSLFRFGGTKNKG